MRTTKITRALAIATAGIAALSFAAGCGASTSAPPSSAAGCGTGQLSAQPDPPAMSLTVAKDPTAAAKVPDAVRAKGTLNIAEDPSYAPNEFTAGNSSAPRGMDIDLANAIGDVLGIKVQFSNASFDGILAGIQSGRYDLGMSSFTDSAEREKTVDFVTYFKAGTSTVVCKGNPQGIHSDLDLCGKKVGAENGTTEIDALTKEDADGSVVKECKNAGKQPPQGKGYPKQTDANAALQSNQIDAYMADSPVADYAVKQTGGAFQVV
ncbi:MAG: ABC transporter substrate-binding protein, partial [Sciscionella sp.]|nr:ABC transporter substrate-binding protein [Sciscionella sp.]